MLIKCVKNLTVSYSSHNGECGDGCCSHLYSGEEDETFETGEFYDVTLTLEQFEGVSIVYTKENSDRVYLNFDTFAEFSEHFSIPYSIKFINSCNETIPAALRFLAETDKPNSGNELYNSEHLYQLADEFERSLEVK